MKKPIIYTPIQRPNNNGWLDAVKKALKEVTTIVMSSNQEKPKK